MTDHNADFDSADIDKGEMVFTYRSDIQIVTDIVQRLRIAGQAVVARWETGDLAMAVRLLSQALKLSEREAEAIDAVEADASC